MRSRSSRRARWEKGIELGCLIDEDAPAGIVGDAARLRQVLLNLLSNAVKFTEEGEVVVLVEAEAAAAGQVRLELAVRDTGIGIPQDRMDRLFTSFSQVDASTTRRYGGTGLGLAISKRLVELMGGTIRAESEEGEGSTFRISLPAEPAELPDAADGRRRTAAAPRETRPCRRRQRDEPRDRHAARARVADGAGRRREWRRGARAHRRGRAVRRCRARHDDAGHGRGRAGARDPAPSPATRAAASAPDLARTSAAGRLERRVRRAAREAAPRVSALQRARSAARGDDDGARVDGRAGPAGTAARRCGSCSPRTTP